MAVRVRIGVADLRAEGKFRSERVDQLIWGQEVQLLNETEGEYVRVRAPDGYEAFIIANSLKKSRERIRYKLSRSFAAGDLRLPLGSLLTDEDVSRLEVGKAILRSMDHTMDRIILARRYLGVPYLWGGVTEFGTDCSGLTQRVFSFNNLQLPRNADQQESVGSQVESLKDAAPGDLVFFPGHVGMHIGEGMMIHANLHFQRVTITNLLGRDAYSRNLRGSITSIRTYPVNQRSTLSMLNG